MNPFAKKHRWLLTRGMILFAILVLSAWILGWGRGNFHVIGFSAGEADRIELSCTGTRVGLHSAVVTEKNDIQALIDSVNSFQHTLYSFSVPVPLFSTNSVMILT